jgi:hypothetical protein
MSWTADKKYSWSSKRDTLTNTFSTLLDEYRRAIVTDKPGSPRLIELERQMGSAREEIARLGWDINGSLEDLRTQTGNLSEPVLHLDKKLKRLSIEENILKRRKETRQEQVDSLNNRSAPSPHTIGFLMVKPLSNQTYIGFFTIALLVPALYNMYMFGKQALVSAGITPIVPPTRQIFTGQQNYRRRIG